MKGIEFERIFLMIFVNKSFNSKEAKTSEVAVLKIFGTGTENERKYNSLHRFFGS